MEPVSEIDEGLYSRQLYVLGRGAMKKLGECSVLISGMGGLGVEIAKNLALAGTQALTLHDEKNVTWSDLSSQFFAKEKDVGKNRASVSHEKIKELNRYVTVDVYTDALTDSLISRHQVVVLTEATMDDAKRIGKLCHDQSIHFIVANTRGLSGQIFCDFGEQFTIVDKFSHPPSVAPIASLTQSDDGILVETMKDSNASFSCDDFVAFEGVQNMTQLNGHDPIRVKETLNFNMFLIEKVEGLCDFGNGGIVKEVRFPEAISFKSFEESLKSPEIVFLGSKQDKQLHILFQVLDQFLKDHQHLPKPHSMSDAEIFVEMCRLFVERQQINISLNEELALKFAMTSAGNLSPIQSIVGSIAAQEAVKAATGKFIPIQQFMYFSAFEALSDSWDELNEEDCALRDCRYDGQIAIFGSKLQEVFTNKKLFLVGVGAIGCEMLKNWAMMGLGTGMEGLVTMTDMDMIEKSNLNRQFLFRPEHIGSLKSQTAAEVVKNFMNPQMHIDTHENKLSEETENIYTDNFFEEQTAVVNALDNEQARAYVANRCLFTMTPILDSGTEGTFCHVQVVVPGLTRTYAGQHSSIDDNIPLCTLKYFPTTIAHTIQWARDDFEGSFNLNVKTAQEYIEDEHFHENIQKLPGNQPIDKLKEAVEIFCDVMIEEADMTVEKCIRWARMKFEKHFNNEIQQLCYNFPPSHQTAQGLPFWHGSKKCPSPFPFDSTNNLHMDFIVSAANVMAQVFNISITIPRIKIAEIARSVQIASFEPTSNVFIPANDSEAKKEEENKKFDSDEFEKLSMRLPNREVLRNVKMSLIEFEKDSESNYHVDFITASSNLRAKNYDIPVADKLETKRIVGKIIPAIATTTSLVVGLVCIELIKILSGERKLDRYRNWYNNLGSSSFQGIKVNESGKFKCNKMEFTAWDRISIESDPTLQSLIDQVKDKHKLNVDTILYQKSSLFSSLTPKEEKEKRLNMRVSQAIKEITKRSLPQYIKSVRIDVDATDEDGNEFEHLPFIRVYL